MKTVPEGYDPKENLTNLLTLGESRTAVGPMILCRELAERLGIEVLELRKPQAAVNCCPDT
jgi:hypothetical protein